MKMDKSKIQLFWESNDWGSGKRQICIKVTADSVGPGITTDVQIHDIYPTPSNLKTISGMASSRKQV